MKLVTTKFKSGGLHEKHVMATWNVGNHLSICYQAQGNQEKPVSRWPVAGPSDYWLLASSPASKVKTAIHTLYNKYTLDDNNTHKTTTTIHTRQLQQYTQDTLKCNILKWNYIHWWAVKLCAILKVKLALVTPMQYVSEHPICSLVSFTNRTSYNLELFPIHNFFFWLLDSPWWTLGSPVRCLNNTQTRHVL